ncbi:MAG TPA: T9SS type A sorting domain-containing protein [Bacteroidia bacterium]|jgi:hypothetical protein|nr:T9SS type A sorting domain-containing protein [Bacteroidia bacterium]
MNYFLRQLNSTSGFFRSQGKIFFALCFLFTSVKAQTTFENIYGDSVLHLGAGDIIQSSDSGFIVAGGSSTYGNGYTCPAALFKTESNGALLWKKQFFIHDYLMSSTSVKETPDNGFIVTGMIVDSNFVLDPAIMKFRTLLIRTDNLGNVIWEKVFKPATDSLSMGYYYSATSVKEMSNGNFVITGCVSDPQSLNKAYIICTDSNGNLLWSKDYCVNSRYSGGNDLQVDASGNITLLGNDYAVTAGDTNILVLRTDSNGVPQWSRSLRTAVSDSLIPHFDYYQHIETDGTDLLLCGPIRHVGHPSWYGDVNFPYLLKMDNNGNLLWNKIYNNFQVDEVAGYTVKKLNSTQGSGYVLCGTSEDTALDADLLYLIRTDVSGNVTWQRTFGNYTDETGIGYCAVPAFDNGYAILSGKDDPVAVGTFGSIFLIKTDSLGHAPCEEVNRPLAVSSKTFLNTAVTMQVDSAVFIPDNLIISDAEALIDTMVVCPLVNGVHEIPLQKNQVTIYPDPFAAQATLQMKEDLHNASVSIYNSYGEEVKQMTQVKGKDILITRDQLPCGLYIVRVTENGHVVAVQKVMISD